MGAPDPLYPPLRSLAVGLGLPHFAGWLGELGPEKCPR